jgi:hypothetical protein
VEAGRGGGRRLADRQGRASRPGKVWQYRPSAKKLLETAWSPTDEIVPGYPLEPKFDPQAYADRFSGKVRRIGDAAQGFIRASAGS